MTKNKRYKISDEAHYVYSDIYDVDEPLRNDEVVDKLNEQDAEIKRLEDELQNLQTFKKILEFAEKDMEERADWQAYCEKEFEGL